MAQTTYNTLRDEAIEGQLADSTKSDVLAMRNAEASASMPFGYAVYYSAVATDETAAKVPTAITGQLIAGIVLAQHSYADTQLDTTGVIFGNRIDVVKKGKVRVVCEDGCSVGDRLHIRTVISGAEVAGALLAAADGTDTIDSTKQGQWLTAAAAGELAWLEVNFFNEID